MQICTTVFHKFTIQKFTFHKFTIHKFSHCSIIVLAVFIWNALVLYVVLEDYLNYNYNNNAGMY